MSRGYRYEVKPRYTPGSPAMVDQEIAERVAAQEKDAYLAALKGVYGAEDAAKARALGLDGIVEQVYERNGRFEITDLITENKRMRQWIRASGLRQSDKVVQSWAVIGPTTPYVVRKIVHYNGFIQAQLDPDRDYLAATFSPRDRVYVERKVEEP